jgi:hypothetical protein
MVTCDPSEHDQVLGLVGDAQDRVARVVRHLVEAGDVGDERLRSRGDDHALAADPDAVDLELAFADEAGVALVDHDVVEAVTVLPPTLGDRVDATEHAADDRRPIRPVEVGGDAVLGGVGRAARRLGDVGGVDQHLRRDATTVEAGAAEGAAFDHRDAPAVHLGADQRVAGTGTDDDEVEGLGSRGVRHGVQPGIR